MAAVPVTIAVGTQASVSLAIGSNANASVQPRGREFSSELLSSAHPSFFGKGLNVDSVAMSVSKESKRVVCHLQPHGKGERIDIDKRLSDGAKARRNCSHKKADAIPRRNLIMGAAAGMMSILCPICGTRDAAGASEWSYGDLSGPTQWGDLCAVGTGQSPIDVPLGNSSFEANVFGNISFSYSPSSPSFLNTGHGTMQVNYPEGSNYAIVGNKKIELLQYHFHSPSEHAFNGSRTAMEAHLVHRDANGKLAVIGVMIEGVPSAPRNLCLQAALDFSPDIKYKKIPAPVECFDEDPEEKPVRKTCFMLEINPARLLPRPNAEGIRQYIHYEGSLTTPPCSEGVDWFLMTTPIKVPDAQVLEFMRYVGDKKTIALNSRPVQPINSRTLYLGP